MEDTDRALGDGEQSVDNVDWLMESVGGTMGALKICDMDIKEAKEDRDVELKAVHEHVLSEILTNVKVTEDEIKQFVMDGKVQELCHLGCKPEGVGEVDFVKKKLKNAFRNLETHWDKIVLEDPNRKEEAYQPLLNAIDAIIKYVLNRKIDYRTDSLVKVQNELMEKLKPYPDLPLYDQPVNGLCKRTVPVPPSPSSLNPNANAFHPSTVAGSSYSHGPVYTFQPRPLGYPQGHLGSSNLIPSPLFQYVGGAMMRGLPSGIQPYPFQQPHPHNVPGPFLHTSGGSFFQGQPAPLYASGGSFFGGQPAPPYASGGTVSQGRPTLPFAVQRGHHATQSLIRRAP